MENRDNWDQHWSQYDSAARRNPAQAFRRELMVHWLAGQGAEKGGRLLDIGSGQGDFLASLSHRFPGLELAGAEMSATGIAQSRLKAPGAIFYQRDLQQVPPSEDPLHAWATLAVCSEVLEHVDEPGTVLANAAQFLAPGARLFITVPGGPISAFDRHIGHRRHFQEKSLHDLIVAAGLIPEKVSGMGFPFFNLYRMTVILRGKSLIRDISSKTEEQLGWAARTAMAAFSHVLKQRLNSASRGWQMTAQARKPV